MKLDAIRSLLDEAGAHLKRLEDYEARKTRAMQLLVAQIAGHVTHRGVMSRENLVLEALHVVRVYGLEPDPRILRQLLAVDIIELDIRQDDNSQLALDHARRRLTESE